MVSLDSGYRLGETVDKVEIRARIEALEDRKKIAQKKMDFRGAQDLQEKINNLKEELRRGKVYDGGNMYEPTVDWS
jgi:hypothetical protein